MNLFRFPISNSNPWIHLITLIILIILIALIIAIYQEIFINLHILIYFFLFIQTLMIMLRTCF